MANFARSITRGERTGVDGVKGCSCPVDGPGRRPSGARRGRASAGPGQFRARLICELCVGYENGQICNQETFEEIKR